MIKTPEQGILELLYWMRSEGLLPEKYAGSDRFLDPFTRRLTTKIQLKAHQIKYFLWIPTVEGLKHFFPDIKMERVGDLDLITAAGYLGAGPGENEAMLSLINNIKQAA